MIYLYHGDNKVVLQKLIDDGIQVDSVVTDPPYGLSFMGKKWDYDVPSVETWKLIFDILKPGGHLLSFGGTRTYHRLVVNIEDAGFEIRDQIAWLYGSGFPKSMDVSKAIDKAAGVNRKGNGKGTRENANTFDGGTLGNRCETCGKPFFSASPCKCPKPTAVTDDAQRWEGWGTALKPAMEPIVLARKPLSEPTVAANVLKHGTGGVNIDGCRVEYENGGNIASNPSLRTHINGGNGGKIFPTETERRVVTPDLIGRFPANVILDEEAGEILDEQTENVLHPPGNVNPWSSTSNANIYNQGYGTVTKTPRPKDATTGASRFYYCAKASKKERRGSKHPTIKPLALMRYLVRLITPPGGIVLDPFAGSGTTGEAALMEMQGFRPLLIELDAQYVKDIEDRLYAIKIGSQANIESEIEDE